MRTAEPFNKRLREEDRRGLVSKWFPFLKLFLLALYALLCTCVEHRPAMPFHIRSVAFDTVFDARLDMRWFNMCSDTCSTCIRHAARLALGMHSTRASTSARNAFDMWSACGRNELDSVDTRST